MAFTLTLVIGAALFARPLAGLLAKGPEFVTASLISFGIDPIKNGYTPSEANRLVRSIHDEFRASRSTQTAAIARIQLLTGGTWNTPMTIQARQRITTDREVHLNAISSEFFTTLGARIVAGRDFDERASRPASDGRLRVAIVNEAFVKRYMGGQNPLGARIPPGSAPHATPHVTVIVFT